MASRTVVTVQDSAKLGLLMTMSGALSNDNYEVLNGYPGLVTEVNTPTEWPVFFLNWKSEVT